MSTDTKERQARANASLLLDEARQLGLSVPLDLERLAIMRGCHCLSVSALALAADSR